MPKIKSKKSKSKQILVRNSELYDELWYKMYSVIWGKIERRLENLNHTMFSKVLNELLSFVKQSSTIGERSDSIPTAAILTGINLPDHAALFKTIQNEIETNHTPYIAILQSDKCSSLKSVVENMVHQIINNTSAEVS